MGLSVRSLRKGLNDFCQVRLTPGQRMNSRCLHSWI
jgi:hypothetical protein